MSRTYLAFVLAFASLAASVKPLAAQPAPQQPPEEAVQESGETASPSQRAVGDTSPSTESAADATPELSADEEAILANVTAFVEAYNEHDAKAIAELFTQDGQVITELGDTVEGREAIEQGFSDIFADTPRTEMEVVVDSLRFIGDDVAVEVGAIREVAAPGETPEYGRYTVLHVRRDGKWLMAAARDNAGELPTHHERLLPLGWLVGEWVDDGGSTVVHTSCRWSENGNFLLQDMRVHVTGQEAMQVEQRIGWDPLTEQIRSWVFDTEGGFAQGEWTRAGDSWVIRSEGVRTDGTRAAATSEIVPTGTDGYVWRVRDRVIGGELQPPVEVKVVRKPPAPQELTQLQSTNETNREDER